MVVVPGDNDAAQRAVLLVRSVAWAATGALGKGEQSMKKLTVEAGESSC